MSCLALSDPTRVPRQGISHRDTDKGNKGASTKSHASGKIKNLNHYFRILRIGSDVHQTRCLRTLSVHLTRCLRTLRARLQAAFQPPLVAARGAREGLLLEQRCARCGRARAKLALVLPDVAWPAARSAAL